MRFRFHNTLLLAAALLLSAPRMLAAAPVTPAATQAPSDTYYEIFVRSWYDTNGDGVGDLDGVTAKLDYLKSLGVDGIWLMPINPSPSYHGYDITDYEAINPQYGTMADFERLVREATNATLERQYDAYRAAAHGRFDDAPFLSNHDQERVMSQLAGNPAHMRTAAAMLLTLPGHPFVYYGEELGMRGQKPDPLLREPMRWYRAGKGAGETTWEGWSAGDGSAVSVQAEQADPHSLLNWYRMLIQWRCLPTAARS